MLDCVVVKEHAVETLGVGVVVRPRGRHKLNVLREEGVGGILSTRFLLVYDRATHKSAAKSVQRVFSALETVVVVNIPPSVPILALPVVDDVIDDLKIR
jgi:hypothetical protein